MNIPRNWCSGLGVRMLAAAALCACALSVPAQEVDYARTAGGYIGDGGHALQASMAGGLDIAFDHNGYGYVSQFRESRIRKISPDGSLVTTLIGDGIPGFSGDGGPASAARVSDPFGLAVDAAGNIYFADKGNRRVRRISTAGIVTTVAGNGSSTMSGDGGSATAAGIPGPYGLELDAAGNLYISDWEAHVIRKVTPGGVISTFAGNGTAGFSGDGGPATQASLNLPEGMSFDAAGNLYVADAINHRVRRITPGGTISTVAGNGLEDSLGDGGPATQASIYYPYNVLIDPEGGLLVTDANCTIRRVLDGVITTVAGDGSCGHHGDGGPAVLAGIGAAEGMAFDAEGMFYFLDIINGYIRQVDTDTMTISTVAGIGTFRGENTPATEALFGSTDSVAVGPGGLVAVSDRANRMVRVVDASGLVRTLAMDANAFDLAFDGAGNLYRSGGGVHRIAPSGATSLVPGLEGTGARGLAFDAHGNLYVADFFAHVVRKLAPSGTVTTVAGTGVAGFSGDGGPATSAALNNPARIAVDLAGNLYISDSGNSRIRKVAGNGVITTIAGTGTSGTTGSGGPARNAGLGAIYGLAVDRNGILYLAEGTSLRRITPDGRINDLAHWSGFTNDVAVDAAGQLHIATGGATIVQATVLASVPSDFDLDVAGMSDVFWRNDSTGSAVIWRGGNSTSTIPVTRLTNLAWRVVGIGDFDRDGKSDLFWRHQGTGANAIWSGGNSSRRITVPTIHVDWEVVATDDFDGDRVDDVMWRHKRTGANTIWRSANPTTKLPQIGVGNLAWKVVGSGDFDADGRADVLWRNVQTGANTIWKGGNGATPIATTGVGNQAWKVEGVGDFTGDGKADIFWRNAANGANTIWKSGNATTQQATTGITNLAWEVVAVGDYTGDGRSDVFWRNGSNGANTIWRSGSYASQQRVTGVTNVDWKVID